MRNVEDRTKRWDGTGSMDTGHYKSGTEMEELEEETKELDWQYTPLSEI